MKAKNTLLLILGFTSSIALAQSSDPQAPSGLQSQQSQSQSDPQIQSGSQSSGDSGSSQSGTSSSSQTEGRASASSDISARAGAAPIAQLEPKTENGFTYLCGGVGLDEAAQMKQAARDYGMMLTFATRSGAYLADVQVDIKNARGQAELQTTCDGPIMLVDVPQSGTYQIHAKADGYTLNKTARVQAKGRSHAALVLTWPRQLGETVGAEQTSSGAGSESGTSSSGGGTR